MSYWYHVATLQGDDYNTVMDDINETGEDEWLSHYAGEYVTGLDIESADIIECEEQWYDVFRTDTYMIKYDWRHSSLSLYLKDDRTRYIATINTPGYLPAYTEPAVFLNADDAWNYLEDEYARMVDESYDGVYEDAVDALEDMKVTVRDGVGTIQVPSPVELIHDLGYSLTVDILEGE